MASRHLSLSQQVEALMAVLALALLQLQLLLPLPPPPPPAPTSSASPRLNFASGRAGVQPHLTVESQRETGR
jgi:hypothetical protein